LQRIRVHFEATQSEESHMNSIQARSKASIATPDLGSGDMKLEVMVIPVSDADRAKRFYAGLGWRLDMDFQKGDGQFRVIQFTPPGSQCSIIFGKGIPAGAPGSAQGLLVVSDIVAARAALIERGVDVSETFHDAGGVYVHADAKDRVGGAAPARRSYGSYASFNDPDGNGWLLQEITARLPGHVDPDDAKFTTPTELARALRRAAAAHGEHEKRNGKRDADWAAWYADYIIREQAGESLPS
jgi:catechol 2,3-dioxygenase-like lactoylglutathione lyase family enzyme